MTTEEKRSLLKIVLPVLILVFGVAIAGIIMRARPEVVTQERKAPPPLVRVFTARAEDLQLTVRTNGTVVPRTESTLVPRSRAASCGPRRRSSRAASSMKAIRS